MEVNAELEPPRLLRGDGKRPDGATLDPWLRGKYLVWDFTCPDTLAPSHVALSSRAAGAAATQAESSKWARYAELVAAGSYIFCPVAIETLGTWGQSAADLCREIGGQSSAMHRGPTLHCFPQAAPCDCRSEGQRGSHPGNLPHWGRGQPPVIMPLHRLRLIKRYCRGKMPYRLFTNIELIV